MRLANKVALITGAGSGIGRESALLFASEGAQVVAVDLNDASAKETANMIEANTHKGQALALQADIMRALDCEAMIAVTEKAYGRLELLNNNDGKMASRDADA